MCHIFAYFLAFRGFSEDEKMKISIDDLKGIDLFQDIELKKVPMELEEVKINEFLPGNVILSPENQTLMMDLHFERS